MVTPHTKHTVYKLKRRARSASNYWSLGLLGHKPCDPHIRQQSQRQATVPFWPTKPVFSRTGSAALLTPTTPTGQQADRPTATPRQADLALPPCGISPRGRWWAPRHRRRDARADGRALLAFASPLAIADEHSCACGLPCCPCCTHVQSSYIVHEMQP